MARGKRKTAGTKEEQDRRDVTRSNTLINKQVFLGLFYEQVGCKHLNSTGKA